MNPEVLYRDEAVLAVDKPSGMLVHRGYANDDFVLVDWVKDLLGERTVHPVHRLDRQTSGPVVFALSPEWAKDLGAQFESARVEKLYLALVRGEAPERGLIDHPVPRSEEGPRVDAVTEFERCAILETVPRHTSWLKVTPHTGRFHQIRRHLKHISHPIIGDANYGKGDINRAFRETYDLCRTALHAAAVSFVHPVSSEKITVCSAVPPDLKEPLLAMGLPLGKLLPVH